MNEQGWRIGRRRFLQAAALGVAAGVGGLPRLMGQDAKPDARSGGPRSADDVKAALKGPILSVPTPFTRDFAVDYDGVRRMIERALAHDIRVFSLTAGNSYYHAMSFNEIKELTRVMVETVAGRGITIAAGGNWWTDRVVEYGEYAASIGADAYQVMLPGRTDAAGQVEHYRAAASASGLPIVLHGIFTHAIVEKLVEIDAVIALKEDSTLDDYIDKQRLFGERIVVFAGGPKKRFLVAYPYGSRAFYSLFSTFAPQVPQQFWAAIQAGDLAPAQAIVDRYEFPFFDRWSHAMWRASLEHFGVAQRYLRPPEKSFSEAQMADVAKFFDGLGLRREA